MNKDQVEGKVQESKGKVKAFVGKVLDDQDIEDEGNLQKNVGKVQSGYGNIKENIKKK